MKVEQQISTANPDRSNHNKQDDLAGWHFPQNILRAWRGGRRCRSLRH